MDSTDSSRLRITGPGRAEDLCVLIGCERLLNALVFSTLDKVYLKDGKKRLFLSLPVPGAVCLE